MSAENTNNNGRRSFLKKTGLGLLLAVPASVVAEKLVTGGVKARAADAPMLAESDPQAKALGYFADAKKVDKKWTKKYGPGGEKQFCYNCMFYKPTTGKPEEAKKTKSAPCTIFANKQVASMGWCNSWTQNPVVKD